MKPNDRIERVALRLTPLSPVHVGCGEDFDPTGYVIHEGVLYHFDAATLGLDAADRAALLACANRPGGDAILAMQRFFQDRAELCRAAARLLVPVVPGVADQYLARVGQVAQREGTGGRVTNRLEIERTAHHPHSGVAYLPGSSLKGSMRTAWLDRLNQGRPREASDRRANDLEKRLLRGSFHTDPLRLLAVADAAGADVLSQVVFSTNHKKRAVFKDGQELPGQGPVARRECIAPAQYGALSCAVAVDSLAGQTDPARTPEPAMRLPGWCAIAASCNAYYVPRLRRELQLLDERRFVAPEWSRALLGLLDGLGEALATGDAMLLRVGRHSGAESVTLDGVREIRIMKGRGQPAAQGTEATTVWLAAARENDRSGMQPFGWVLAHREGRDLPRLRDWCAAQPRPDVAAARASLAAERARVQQAAAQAAAEQARRAALQAAEAEVAAQEQARLQSLSPQGREVEAMRTQLLAHTAARRQPLGGALYPKVRQLVQRAEQGSDWTAPDRARLAELLRTLVPEKIDLGGKAKEIRQAAARLAGEA